MKPLAIFLYPDSAALRERWWHRLVSVALWGWIAYLIVAVAKAAILDPHQSCMAVKYSQYSDGTLDCGPGMLDYALSNFASTSWGDVAILTLMIAAVGYLSILIPSLVYRVALYIGTGGKWKQWSNP